jgi:hypothetical protein
MLVLTSSACRAALINKNDSLLNQAISFLSSIWSHGSMVEHLTTDQKVVGSIPTEIDIFVFAIICLFALINNQTSHGQEGACDD